MKNGYLIVHNPVAPPTVRYGKRFGYSHPPISLNPIQLGPRTGFPLSWGWRVGGGLTIP